MKRGFIDYLDELEYEDYNMILSKNGALEYSSTGSFLVDLDARTTELRNASYERACRTFENAYEEDYIGFVKLLFYIGDIRGGKGERRIFNMGMDWLIECHADIALKLLGFIPEYTRWDYLVRHLVSDNENVAAKATDIVVAQLKSDIDVYEKYEDEANISLLAKWLPSLQTKRDEHKVIVRYLLKTLNMTEREYRHMLSKLRARLNVIEKYMSIRDYESINMECMTSKQQLRYSEFLKRTMAKKREEYIEAVLRGEKKMNTSVLNPLDVIHEYTSGHRRVSHNKDLEAIWSLLPDYTGGNCNTLVIRDGSGSMTDYIGVGSQATMLEAADALAIYCSEHMQGPFKDKFITFSRTPRLVDMSECETLADKINLLSKYTDCSNTNIERTFDLILDIAASNNLSQDELPKYLLILSDMEFDCAIEGNTDTLFNTIRAKWENAGYKMPVLCFWQLNGRRTIYPEIDSENGIVYLSGYSAKELELVMAGSYENAVTTVDKIETEVHILTPLEQLKLKLSNARYSDIEKALNISDN